MNSNEEVVNYKFVDLIEVHNFGMRLYEFNYLNISKI